jgi:5-methylcytosine-specific restriction endonuclease McrA
MVRRSSRARRSLPRTVHRADDRRDLSRTERLARILERDGAHCVWCRRPIDTDLVRATTEHVVPRIKGGPSWIENEVAACARCNRQRGHRTPAEWLDECTRRGWEPDGHTVARALRALDAAIAARGGQRRARPYVRSQRRRLAAQGWDGLGSPGNSKASSST